MKSSLGGVEGWCNYEHNKVFCYPFCLFFLPKQGRKQDLGGYKKINRGSVGLERSIHIIKWIRWLSILAYIHRVKLISCPSLVYILLDTPVSL